VIALLRRDGLPKGDALATACIAGIMGASGRRSWSRCATDRPAGVTVELEPGEAEVRIRATVSTTDRTGVRWRR
jgi:cyclic pyranopterin phosphate synthase